MKKALIIAVILLASVVALATWFVVVAETPTWIDPNEVGNSTVYALEFMQGQTALIRDEEKNAGRGITYDVISTPEGFAFDLTEPNTFQAVYVPPNIGIYYAKVDARVTRPYRAGLTHITYAFRVRQSLYHDPNVTFEVLDEENNN